MSKPPLLYLCHRIPYPPNKGDKIRSYHLLLQLLEDYEVHLGCFVDDPFDMQYVAHLQDRCTSVFAPFLNKRWSTLRSATALLHNAPLSLPYYYRHAMQRWVDSTIAANGIDTALVFSSTMAQYLERHPALHQVVDFVDVDSDKWRQYANGASWPASWVYRRESRTLSHYEQQVATQVTHSLFVSPQEAELFRQQIDNPVVRSKVGHLLNGVDTTFFDPQADDIQHIDEEIEVVFTGAMDYWANVDAVLWFVDKVWPLVRQQRPDARLHIVGGNPNDAVKALDGQRGIVVTGRVADVRPYIKQARVTVAPLQIARGIQNKVLEAMAMARPVIATGMAIEGIDATTEHVHVYDDARLFAEKVNAYCQQSIEAGENRQWILTHLQWQQTLLPLTQMLQPQG